MNFRYPRHRILEIVQAPKCLSEGHELEVAARGASGASFECRLPSA